jgi:hypothetical protein
LPGHTFITVDWKPSTPFVERALACGAGLRVSGLDPGAADDGAEATLSGRVAGRLLLEMIEVTTSSKVNPPAAMILGLITRST